MPGNPLPPKKEVALALLERESVHVHLDPRAGGVVVPAWFKRQPQLVLQVGLNMPVPIPDLRVDEDGMSCTLSFNRSPFFCIVPWSSVYAMVGNDGRGMVWPEDVPPEVALKAQSRETEPTAKKPAPAKRALAVVKSAPEAPHRTTSKGAGAKPRTLASAADASTSGTAKKPRAKKARATGSASTEQSDGRSTRSPSREAKGRGGQGVVIAIPTAPAASTKSGQKSAAAPPSPPAPQPTSHANARPERPAQAPASPTVGGDDKPTTTSPRSPATRPTAPSKPSAGKTKREIPPYLRIVK